MYKFLTNHKGSVTILLSIILIPIMSLSSLMIEIGRAVSAKAIVKEAENSSVMSLLASYEQVLLEDYGVLGAHVENDEQLNEDFLKYMNFNSDNDGDNANAFSSVYNIKECSVDGVYKLADAKVLMHSLLESGKYTQAYAIADKFLDISGLLDEVFEKIGFGAIKDKLNGIKNKIHKAANVLAMMDSLRRTYDSIYELLKKGGSIEALHNKIGGLVTAIDAKKQFEEDHNCDENGIPQPAPDSTGYDNTNNIYGALKEIFAEIEADEDLDKPVAENAKQYLYKLDISWSYTENNEEKTYTNREILDSLCKKYDEYGIEFHEGDWNKDNVESSRDSAEDVKNTKKSELTNNNDYYKEIVGINKDINSAINKVRLQIMTVKDDVDSYSSQLNSAIHCIVEFKGGDTDEADSVDNAESVDNAASKVNGALSKLCEYSGKYVEEVDNALVGADRILGDLDCNETAARIWKSWSNSVICGGASYLIERILNYGELKNLIEDLDEPSNWTGNFWSMLKAIGKLANVLKPWPSLNNSDDDVEMTGTNANIRLGNTDLSNGPLDAVINRDITNINSKIDFGNDIVAGRTEELTQHHYTNDPTDNGSDLLNSLMTLAKSIKNLVDSIGGLITGKITDICKNIGNVASSIGNIFGSLVGVIGNIMNIAISSAYNNIMLTQYALGHFKNRLSDEGNEKSDAYPVFHRGELEYIFIGNTSEKTNENSVAMIIFTYRLINNLIAVLTDANAMKIISACNFLAPVVAIVWIYYETCIDSNMLFVAKTEFSVIKSHLWISVDTLKEIGDAFEDLEEDATPEETLDAIADKIGDDNNIPGLNFGYVDYIVLLMSLMSNTTKTQRIGDLIQWHVRNKTSSDFLLRKTYTTFRAETKATLNPLLPIINLSETHQNGVGLTNQTEIEQVFYEGY